MRTFILIFIKRNKKDKAENNEVDLGVDDELECISVKWSFTVCTFLYSFDFWKHVNVVHIKKNKSIKNGRGLAKAESKPEQINQFIIQMSNKHN